MNLDSATTNGEPTIPKGDMAPGIDKRKAATSSAYAFGVAPCARSMLRLPEADDFVIVKRNPSLDRRGAFAIVGPGLDLGGIPFVRVEDAINRGREIAEQSGVSLWDATTPSSIVLVGAFRLPARPTGL